MFCILFCFYISCNYVAGTNSPQQARKSQYYDASLDDERLHVKTFYTSIAGAITSSISGGISAISSLYIMIFIYRSTIKLTTVYHRIMFGMSVVDLISSVAMAFSTLPMPKDMIYKFGGKSIGNELSCTVQGFSANFGIMATLYYNISLFLYYLLSIRYKKSDETIKKCIEPLMHFSSILLALPLPVMGLYGELLNPYPYSTWCTLHGIPYYCKLANDDAASCIMRGRPGILREICVLYAIISITLAFVLQILFFALTVYDVYRQEKYIKRIMKDMRRFGNTSERMLATSRKRHSHTKVLLVQGLAYFIAFAICQVSSFAKIREETRSEWGSQIYHASCRPLQGFFNVLIFVGHKAYDLKRMNPELSTREAIMSVLKDREERLIFLSNTSLVCVDNDIHFDGIIDNEDDHEDSSMGLASHRNNNEVEIAHDELQKENECEEVSQQSDTEDKKHLVRDFSGEDISFNHPYADSFMSVSRSSNQSIGYSDVVSSDG